MAAGEFVEAEQVSAEQVSSEASPASSSFEQPQQEAQTVETQGQPQNFAQPQNFQQPFAQQYQEAPQQQANPNQFANQGQAYQQQGFQQASPFAGQAQSSGPQAYQNNPQQGQFNSQVPQQGPQAYYSQQPPQPNEFSKTMKGFWTWLVSAWKSPTSEVESSKVNGYLSLGLTVFFFAIVANSNVYSIINMFRVYSLSLYDVVPSLNFKVFFVSLIAAALFLFSIILGGFVVKRLVYQDRSFTFNKAFDWYGRLYAIVLPFIAVSALFALLGIIHLSLFFTWIGLLLVGVGATFALIYSKTNNSMDPFYKYLLAIIVNGVITLFFSFIAFSLLTSIAMM